MLTAIPNKPKLYTARQVADYLGMALNSVYTERAAGRLPAEPHGQRSYRWTQEAVDAYRRSATPAKPVPSDLTALIDQRIAAALEAVVTQLRGA